MSEGLIAGFDAFALRRAGEPDWLAALRRAARDAFVSRGLPTRRDEDWRFTPTDALAKAPLPPREPAPLDASVRAAVARARAQVGGAEHLVFVDGHFAPSLSDLGAGLSPVSARLGELGGRLGALCDVKARAFEALNTALFSDGAFVSIEASAGRERVVHVIYVSADGAPGAAHLRAHIELAPGSRATLVEHFVGASSGAVPSLTTAISEIRLRPGAHLRHLRLQDETLSAFHFGGAFAELDSGARLEQTSLALGAGLSRVEVRVALQGEGAHVELDGLYAGRGRQHLDHHTSIDHAMPRTTSAELYKGILGGRAHGVFHGRIHVRPDAQQIEARQTNRTLLLSDDARVNTKPQLEIYADDVRCSHGASVGSLDADALFYLRSRGIDAERARGLLTLGFAREVSERVTLPVLRYALESRLVDFVLRKEEA